MGVSFTGMVPADDAVTFGRTVTSGAKARPPDLGASPGKRTAPERSARAIRTLPETGLFGRKPLREAALTGAVRATAATEVTINVNVTRRPSARAGRRGPAARNLNAFSVMSPEATRSAMSG